MKPRPRHGQPSAAALAAALMFGAQFAGAGPDIDSLVDAQWLADNLAQPDLVVLDCSVLVEPDGAGGLRSVSGRDAYDAAHIPTAGFADLFGALADTDSPLNFAVPSPRQFADAMGALGVGDDTRVVLYDSTNSVWAARVWWMLRWIGFDNAALLDGGKQGWIDAGFELTSDAPDEPRRQLSVALRPQLIAGRDEVMAAIGDDDVHLIDALTAEHYRGDFSLYARPGHISTARNVPMTSLMGENGRFKPLDELAELFEEDSTSRVITYCGGGIAASADAFVMIRLGYEDIAVYAASLQEWTADPESPMTTGDASEAP
jgi:thiosulfate/3-mercaptopyruvate sulfurtransferase